jgi:hypothetical protein
VGILLVFKEEISKIANSSNDDFFIIFIEAISFLWFKEQKKILEYDYLYNYAYYHDENISVTKKVLSRISLNCKYMAFANNN